MLVLKGLTPPVNNSFGALPALKSLTPAKNRSGSFHSKNSVSPGAF